MAAPHAPDKRQRQRRNRFESALLLGSLGFLLGAIGWILSGTTGLMIVAGFGIASVLVARNTSVRVLLQLAGARRIDWGQWPTLDALVMELTARTGLAAPPRLFRLPVPMMAAFTIGTRAEDAAVVLSDQLLQGLSTRQLAGVLAHEFSHIQARDIFVMSLADSVSRMTRVLSLLGLLLLVFNLPLYAMGKDHLPWVVLWLLVLAPHVSMLLQMALSRSREYEADLAAIEITGDPKGLAEALTRLEVHQMGLLERLAGFRLRAREPSLLRSHPETEKRVERLLAIPVTATKLPAEFLDDEPVTAVLPSAGVWRRFVPVFGFWK